MCPDILVHGTRFCYVSDVGPLSALCWPLPPDIPRRTCRPYVGLIYYNSGTPTRWVSAMSALCRPLEYIFPWKAYVCSQKTPLHARRAEVDLGADHGLGFYLDRNSDNVMAPFGRSSHVG